MNFDAGGRDLLGRVVEVRIARALPHSLRGELVDAPGPATMPAPWAWPSPRYRPRRRRTMWLEMKVKGLALDPLSNMPMIILRDEEEKRSLPIWVGLFEANAIALELEKISTAAADDPRPHQEHPRVARRAGAEGRGERPAGEHLLRGAPPPARQRRHHGRLAPLGRHRAGPAGGRADLRGGGRRGQGPHRRGRQGDRDRDRQGRRPGQDQGVARVHQAGRLRRIERDKDPKRPDE